MANVNTAKVSEPDEAKIKAWLVEHISGAKMSRPRMAKLKALEDQYSYLKPPDVASVYRGLRNIPKRAAGNRLGASDPVKDKSWTTSQSIASRFATTEFTLDDPDTDKVGVVLTADANQDHLLLNFAEIAELEGVGDVIHDVWDEPLSIAILDEREVLAIDELEITEIQIIPMTKSSKQVIRPFTSRGEKSAWRDLVIASIPPNATYVEAFAGSATVFFAREKRSDHEVLIDTDSSVIALYKFLQAGDDADFTWLREQEWTWDPTLFTKLRKSKPRSRRDKAYRIKYLDTYSKQGRRSEICTSDRARAAKAVGFLRSLEKLHERLAGVEIIEGDAIDQLAKFDSDDAFLYLDLPRDFPTGDLSKLLSGLSAKVLISTSGDADFGDTWASVEIDASQAAKRQTLLINFASVTTKFDDCDLYYSGGSHWHVLDRDKRTTEFDGPHSHLFLISGLAVTTDWGGEHLHLLDDPTASHALDSLSEHTHHLDRPDAETELGGAHPHELEVGSTIYGGIHQHDLIIDDVSHRSISPGEFWGLFNKSQSKVKTKVKSELTYPSATVAKGGFFERIVDGAIELLFVSKAGDIPIVWSIDVARSPVDLPFTTPLGDRARKSIVDQALRAVELDSLDREGLHQIDSCDVEFGVWTKSQRELFISKAGFYSGTLRFERDITGWAVSLSKTSTPLVMLLGSGGAPSDRSLLPVSLAKQVPEPLRFWDGGSMIAFMRSNIFEDVRVVEGSLVRCRAVIVPNPELISAEVDAVKALINWGQDDPVIIGADLAKTGEVNELVSRLESSDQPYLVQWPSSPAAAASLAKLGPVFEVGSDPRFMFVASAPVACHPDLRPVIYNDRVNRLVKRAIDQGGLRIIKADDQDEEQFVLGIALEPLDSFEPDLQQDFYNAAEIRMAAHGFMENHANVGFMHRAVINDKAAILESYLAPVEFAITRPDGTEKIVREGTWLIGFGIRDADIWAGIKSGDLRGPSIGGFADRVPAKSAS